MTDFSPSFFGTSPWRPAEGVRPGDELSAQRAARALSQGQDAAPGREADSVELSDRARLIASIRPAGSDRESERTFRPELVDRVRREIEAGSYESGVKETIAADRLARALGGSLDEQA
ncbi:MAG: flagellar biosynthesis anti-sigma factor FlgM [Phycisphaeraceae bacterium]|nr:flagellar biosynthesis anti-sigma factor FlgM [Phycisphaeraceae bacterium]